MIPQRVVSLVPSTTETVCALGAVARLAGCTRWCTHPAEALRPVPRVGGTKNPKLEAIAALRPDLVLGNAEENRAEDLAWLRERFPVLVTTPRSVPEAAAAVRALADALGDEAVRTAATALGARIDAALACAAAASAGRGEAPVYYAIWKKPWMSASADTYLGDVLARAGGANVCAGEAQRYPECDPATARERGARVVLLASEPWTFTAAERDEVAASGAFGADAEVVLCDGRDFCWHGAHTPEGLANAVALLLPFRPPRA